MLTDAQIKAISDATFAKVQAMPDASVNGDTWEREFARGVLAAVVDLNWRTEAVRWLRRRAEEVTPEADRTGFANPAYWKPHMLNRAAEELEAEQEAAPYGEDGR
jgi:hypothetical protein